MPTLIAFGNRPRWPASWPCWEAGARGSCERAGPRRRTCGYCWHQWPARAERNLRQLVAGRASAWTLPVTATEEERLLADADEPLSTGRGLIAVSSPVFALADWLMAACGRSGYGTVWLRPPHRANVERATAVIFDGSECRGEELDELRRVATELAARRRWWRFWISPAAKIATVPMRPAPPRCSPSRSAWPTFFGN